MAEATAPVRVEPAPKWIRGYRRGHKVVDSRAAKLVWTHPRYPTWFFPSADVAAELATGAAVAESPFDELAGHVTVRWDAVDHWFEEDVEVFGHPRSPYTRIDILPSSRHVRVSIDGTVVADSSHPRILFETGLPPRCYLPPTDVRLDLLSPTESSSVCPYKGTASYWTATIGGVEHRDVAWSYPTPLPESNGVAGLICFYDERVDIDVDGERRARPDTPFSRPA